MKKLTSSQIIILGFLLIILIGAVLLTLPISIKGGRWGNFLDSIFTATSAVCVTGLVVQDTATYWSPFGHFLIISLIQIGGMGFITIALSLSVLSGEKIGLRKRSIMRDSVSATKVGGIVKLTNFIIKNVIIIESLGAIILSTVFIREFGGIRGILYGFFHSVSAFCNAGFDLMGVYEPFSSLTAFINNPVINITIMLLIIIGGLGFITWSDIKRNRLHFKRYSMQSKIIISYTLFLIFAPAIYFFFFEFEKMNPLQRVLPSLFQSVTCRTAGFNTADLTKISEPGIMVMIILMLIGASPGSTGGGMKITTFAVLIGTSLRIFRRRKETVVYGRKISEDGINKAVSLLMIYIFLSIFGAVMISLIENLPIITTWFETASAIGTVGLTLGITKELSFYSKIVLIVLMYIGRVGGLTLIFSAKSMPSNEGRYPEGQITLG